MARAARILTARPTLIVPDVAAAAAFYEARLGFEIDGVFGVGYAIVNRGGAVLHFAGMADELRSTRSPAPNGDYTKRWSMWDVYFHTDDVEALYAELLKRGAEIVAAPFDAAHGNREFHVRDLNGYLLAFGQDLETDGNTA
ncbi:MAG: VOC family protein [Pseudomonadota bacterium]